MFERVERTDFAGARERGFNFAKDVRVLNELAQTLLDRRSMVQDESGDDERQALALLTRSVEIDPDQPIAHWLLARLYDMLGDEPNATRERALHERCRVDDHAKDEAVRLARERYPWADHAAEATVFYELRSDPSFISPHSTRVISCQPLMKPSGASK